MIPTPESFTHLETPPLLVKYASGPLSNEELLSCHLLRHGASVFPVSSKGQFNMVASSDMQGDVEDRFFF
jgi:hypothetical protein